MGLTSKSALYSEGPSCQVHPQVLFSIVDHFSRREGGQNRVIGTLLGTVGADGVVEVDSCFPVPHTETEEQVAVNTDFHATMLQLHQRVHPKQKVVGWYSTGEEVNDSSILFHDFYGQGVERPVHLLLDLGLGETRMSCKAYVSTQLKLGATVLGTSFSDIKCTVVSAESDRIGMEALMKTANSGGQLAGSTAASPMAEVDSMELTVKKLLRTLDAVIAHVEKARLAPARPPSPPLPARLPPPPRFSPSRAARPPISGEIEGAARRPGGGPPAAGRGRRGAAAARRRLREDVQLAGAGHARRRLPRQPHAHPARPRREAAGRRDLERTLRGVFNIALNAPSRPPHDWPPASLVMLKRSCVSQRFVVTSSFRQPEKVTSRSGSGRHWRSASRARELSERRR